MKKLLIIKVLAGVQVACSTQAPRSATPGALLSFSDLAAEIKVNHETATAVPVSSRLAVEDSGDSS